MDMIKRNHIKILSVAMTCIDNAVYELKNCITAGVDLEVWYMIEALNDYADTIDEEIDRLNGRNNG